MMSIAAEKTVRAWQRSGAFRVGQWVEIGSAQEILATLDQDGSLDGLPFMPEMLQYCGRRFQVYRSAHKTCDTISDWAIRTMNDAVHLDLRCEGNAHGNCQAGCLLFWKTRWLKPLEGADAAVSTVNATTSQARVQGAVPDVLSRATLQPGSAAEMEPRYRCQATELRRATKEVRRRDRWNPLLYVKDLTSGNVSLGEFLWFGTIAVVNSFTRRWFGRRYPHLCGLAGSKTPSLTLDLHPGELIQVRSKDEIMQSVNADFRNRGLSFDVEMVRFCGTERRVLRRVEQILDEKTGRMMRMPNPCIILDGAVCSGTLSVERMFCPRSIFPYWREIWLKRVSGS